MLPAVVLSLLLIGASVVADRYHPGIRARPAPVAAAVRTDPLEATAEYWAQEAQEALTERLATYENLATARNVIMFLGDGLSVPTLAAARALLGQRQGRPGEEAQLSFESWPTVGLAKTYCLDAQIADSACTATAYLCGAKANYGTLGVTGAVSQNDCDASTDPATHLDSIAAWALEDGRDAGIVTTTRVTHASPAGAYANSATREWENDGQVTADGQDPARCPDIADQLINSYPGNRFKVILGGGRREFLPNTTVDEEGTFGRRTDARDLIDEWRQDKQERGEPHAYVWHRQQLLNASVDGYLLGLFEDTHLPYNLEVEEEGRHDAEPTLAELTEAAIRRLERNPRGYFLFVEAGRIDHAHHDNYVHLALDETLELSAAVTRARELVGEDTLLVLTADHAHVMTYNGYSQRGTDILGVSDDLDWQGVPFHTLSYTNGPGFRAHTAASTRPDVREDDDYRQLHWRATVEVPLESETHGGDDVAVFAVGPRHHVFTGLYEQSQLPHLMAYAACIGPGRHACSAATTPAAVAPLAALAASLLARLF